MKCSLCKNELTKNNCSFFRVPAEEHRRTRWNKSCSTVFSKNARVCEAHFRTTDFINSPGDQNVRLRLQPGAVPFIGSKPTKRSKWNPIQISKHPMSAPIVDCPVNTTNNLVAMRLVGSLMASTANSDRGQTATQPDLIAMRCRFPARMNCSTQMYHVPKDSAQIANRKLSKKIQSLEGELVELRAKLLTANSVIDLVKPFFTSGQIKKITNSEKNIKWKWEDISNAICLHTAGPGVYNHLYDKGFPLPHVSTLYRWEQEVAIPGSIEKIEEKILG